MSSSFTPYSFSPPLYTQVKSYTASIPLTANFRGTPWQVYASSNCKNGIVNKITTVFASAVVGADLIGNTSHFFTLKVERDFDGTPENIVGNSSNSQSEFSLRVVSTKDINFFVKVYSQNNSDPTNGALKELTQDLLGGKTWDKRHPLVPQQGISVW